MTSSLRCTAFALLVLLPTSGATQSAVAVGDSLRLAGDLVGAVGAYHEARRAGDDVAYALAATFALHPQFADSAFHYLDRALADETSMRPLWDADLYLLTTDDRWAAVEGRQLDKLEAQVTGAFDRVYARELLRMRMKEWAYRYHIMLAFRQLGPDSPVLTALSQAMGERHDENLSHLQDLIEERGWPTLSAVGEEAAYAAGNVINHSDLATRQRYLPVLEAVCERSECDGSRYAHILDRTELERGNPQVYGTQMEMDEAAGRYVPRPIVDPDRVDERRAARGMEPIADQLRRFNESMARDFGDG